MGAQDARQLTVGINGWIGATTQGRTIQEAILCSHDRQTTPVRGSVIGGPGLTPDLPGIIGLATLPFRNRLQWFDNKAALHLGRRKAEPLGFLSTLWRDE